MAIVIERTITVKNDTATLDNPLYLYVGDGNITCLFTIKEIIKTARFGRVNTANVVEDDENIDYGEVRIYKPTGELVFTTRAEIIDSKLQVLFSSEHIDQIEEAGVHQLQIHLYDAATEGEGNRYTIPPVELNVLYPVGTEVDFVDSATVGYAVVKASGEPAYVFNPDGSYNKTEWVKGDKITSNKLNKIEDALQYAIDNQEEGVVYIPYVNETGYLSWSNNGGLENPAIVNVRGPKGDKGDKGDKGEDGINGVDGKDGADGTVAFEDLTEEQIASLKGDKGEKGDKGDQGDSFTYNDLTDEDKANLTQGFVTCTDGVARITRIEVVYEYPANEEDGVLYIKVSE